MADVFYSEDRFLQRVREVAADPSPDGHCMLAREYNLRSIYDKALAHARSAIALDEFHWDAWFEMIMASGFKSDDTLKQIKEKLESILDAPPKDQPVQPGLYRNLALINYFLEQDALALGLADQALVYDQQDPLAYEVKGHILHAMRRFREALSVFARAVELAPGNCRSMRMIGKCYMDAGETEKGIVKVEQALRIEPCFVAAWHLLGETYLEKDDLMRGLQCFAKALSINPRDWGSYFFLAEYFMGRGDYDIAIAEVKKLFLFEEDPAIRSEALNLIGYAHFLQGNRDDAAYYFNSAVAFNPDYALGYFNLGEMELHARNYAKAIHYYEQALKRDPHHIPSITQAGFAHLNLKQTEQAEEMFRIAVDLDPEEFSAYLGLSECARARRRFREQLAHVLKAVAIAPDRSEVLNYLGIAYQCNQQPANAELAYLGALKADPGNRKAANNLAYLYEKLYNRTDDPERKEEFRKRAIQAWEVRLLACRAAGTSIRGAQNHLINLGLSRKEVENILRMGDITECRLIRDLQSRELDLPES